MSPSSLSLPFLLFSPSFSPLPPSLCLDISCSQSLHHSISLVFCIHISPSLSLSYFLTSLSVALPSPDSIPFTSSLTTSPPPTLLFLASPMHDVWQSGIWKYYLERHLSTCHLPAQRPKVRRNREGPTPLPDKRHLSAGEGYEGTAPLSWAESIPCERLMAGRAANRKRTFMAAAGNEVQHSQESKS